METQATDNPKPYQHYLFFQLDPMLYELAPSEQEKLKTAFKQAVTELNDIEIDAYATLGLKAGTTFMFWCRAPQAESLSNELPKLLRTKLGQYLTIEQTYFG